MQYLPTVVRAHQQGTGIRAYRRNNPSRLVISLGNGYELRGCKEPSWDGIYRTVWSAWRIDGLIPYRVYDVQASTHPNAVRDDLVAWLAGV